MDSKMSLTYGRNMSGNHSSDSSSSGSSIWSSPSPLLHATVPFSWEQQPGIPKQKGSSVRATRSKLSLSFAGENHDELRPPPKFSRSSEAVGNYQSARPRPKSKKVGEAEVGVGVGTLQRDDPFMVALVECRKQQYDHKFSVKDSGGESYNKKKTRWFHLPSFFSCMGCSCFVTNSHVTLPRRIVAKPKKLVRQNKAMWDLIQRRPKGKSSDPHVFDVPVTRNYSDFHGAAWINQQSDGRSCGRIR